jgi:hypothetical protein
MADKKTVPSMPPEVAAIKDRGFAVWASDDVAQSLRGSFDTRRIPVKSIKHVRVWGIQVDDERALPGLERTMIPDEDIWEITLESREGTSYAFDSKLLRPAED